MENERIYQPSLLWAKTEEREEYAAYDNYHNCVQRLYKRFSRKGYVTISIGLKPAPYKILEDMAWVKYVVNGKQKREKA